MSKFWEWMVNVVGCSDCWCSLHRRSIEKVKSGMKCDGELELNSSSSKAQMIPYMLRYLLSNDNIITLDGFNKLVGTDIVYDVLLDIINEEQ